eukprot:g3933.t1
MAADEAKASVARYVDSGRSLPEPFSEKDLELRSRKIQEAEDARAAAVLAEEKSRRAEEAARKAEVAAITQMQDALEPPALEDVAEKMGYNISPENGGLIRPTGGPFPEEVIVSGRKFSHEFSGHPQGKVREGSGAVELLATDDIHKTEKRGEGCNLAAPGIEKLEGEVTKAADANHANLVGGLYSKISNRCEDRDPAAEEGPGGDGVQFCGEFYSPFPIRANLVGKAPVTPDDHCVRVGAKLLSAGQAWFAGKAAPGNPSEAHAIAYGETFHLISDFLDRADDFMAGNEGVFTHAPIVIDHGDIRVADSTGFDVYLDLFRTELTGVEFEFFELLGGAFKGVLIGFILVVVAVPVLFFNEGSAVKTRKTLEEGEKSFVSVSPELVDPANDGKLIYLTGPALTDDKLGDPQFPVSSDALRLKRKVEMYQWEENTKTETKKKLGGGEETVTTYDYVKTWGEKRNDSSRFKRQQGHTNPEMPVRSEVWTAKPIRVGAFELPDSLASKIDNFSSVSFDPETDFPEEILGKKASVSGGTIYLGGNPSAPEVGDLRIVFEETLPGPVSIISQQRGNSFEAFVGKAGGRISMLETGVKTPDEMFVAAHAGNRMMTWFLRALGAVLMFIGFSTILRPLSVFADVVPLFGSIVGVGTGLVALLLTIPFSLIIISVAWIFYRPLIGIPLVRFGIEAETQPQAVLQMGFRKSDLLVCLAFEVGAHLDVPFAVLQIRLLEGLAAPVLDSGGGFQRKWKFLPIERKEGASLLTVSCQKEAAPEVEASVSKNEGRDLVMDSIEAHGGAKQWYDNGQLQFRWSYHMEDRGPEAVVDTLQTVDTKTLANRHEVAGKDIAFGMTKDGEYWIDPEDAEFSPPYRFWALTPYYFIGIPFVFNDENAMFEKLEETMEFEGKDYTQVKVTYTQEAGDSPDDYYVLLIDPETKITRGAYYIVTNKLLGRDKAAQAVEKFITLDDLKDVSGVKLAAGHRTFSMEGGKIAGKMRYTDVSENNGLLLTGAVAYSAMLSLVPLAAVLVVIFSQFFDEELLLNAVNTEVALITPEATPLIAGILKSFLASRQLAGWIGVLVLLFFSTMAFRVLENAFSIIYHSKAPPRKRSFWVSALIPYLFIGLVAAGLIVITSITAFAESNVGHSYAFGGQSIGLGWLAGIVLRVSGFIGLVLLFSTLYKVMPVTRISYRLAFSGGLSAALMWELLRVVLVGYFNHLSIVNAVYGSMATTIILLVTLEAAALIVLLGAQVIAELQRNRRLGLPWYEDSVEETEG